jgi:hypothetical protein
LRLRRRPSGTAFASSMAVKVPGSPSLGIGIPGGKLCLPRCRLAGSDFAAVCLEADTGMALPAAWVRKQESVKPLSHTSTRTRSKHAAHTRSAVVVPVALKCGSRQRGKVRAKHSRDVLAKTRCEVECG